MLESALLKSFKGLKISKKVVLKTRYTESQTDGNAFTAISTTSGIFEIVRRSVDRRIEACILAVYRNFENLL